MTDQEVYVAIKAVTRKNGMVNAAFNNLKPISRAEVVAAARTVGITVVEENLPPIVKEISRRQCKQWLLENGLLDAVESAIAQMSRKAQIDWADAQTFEYNYPLVNEMMTMLGKTEADKRTMFWEASKL